MNLQYNYDSNNDDLISAVDLSNSLGIVGKKENVKKEDFAKVVFTKLGDLSIDMKYQRLLNETMIKNAGRFDPKLLRPLLVYRRPDGKLALVDGQHVTMIGLIYTLDSENCEVPVQILEHNTCATVKECVEQEAILFKKLNVQRTNVSAVAQLRADIAAGDERAKEIEAKLEELDVHVEKIGSENGYAVKGYAKLLSSIDNYGIETTKQAILYYVKLLISKTANSKWKTKNVELQGAMIGGFASVFHLLNNLKRGSKKHDGLFDFLESELIAKRYTPKELQKNTAGSPQFVLIGRRIIDDYSAALAWGLIEGAQVGENTLSNWGLGDPSSVNNQNNKDEE